MREKEVWKPIQGYDNYRVSSYGRIKSIERYVSNSTGYRKVRERILKACSDKDGYLLVFIRGNDGKYRSPRVHRLVALAFIPNIEEKSEVNHLDFDRTNSYFKNLEWITHDENILYSVKACRFKRANAKNVKPVIGINVKNGYILILESIISSKNYGFQPSSISATCRGKQKTAKGYAFDYL